MKKHHFSDVFYHYLEAKLSIQKKKVILSIFELELEGKQP